MGIQLDACCEGSGEKVELISSKWLNAPVVQLEERQPPKLDVTGSNPVGRGLFTPVLAVLCFYSLRVAKKVASPDFSN